MILLTDWKRAVVSKVVMTLTSVSVVLGASLDRLFWRMSPATLKTLSEGVDVTGGDKTTRAIIERIQ